MIRRIYLNSVNKVEIEQIVPKQPLFKLSTEERYINGNIPSTHQPKQNILLSPEQERRIKLIHKLRELTGSGMIYCRHALIECEWDIDKSVEYLRNHGIVRSI